MCIYINTLYITIIVVFLTAFSTCASLLSSKIHNGDDTPKVNRFVIIFTDHIPLCVITYLLLGNITVQWTYKSQWGAFTWPLLPWKSSKYYIFWVCVCSFCYPACKAHAPYCHMWSTLLYNTFPHYLINGTIFGKSYWTQNVCFDFLHKFCLKHFSF